MAIIVLIISFTNVSNYEKQDNFKHAWSVFPSALLKQIVRVSQAFTKIVYAKICYKNSSSDVNADTCKTTSGL